MRPAARAVVLFAVCLALVACAARHIPHAPATDVWQGYLDRQQALAGLPRTVDARASLYYTADGRTNRTLVSLWGDLDHPLRAEITASIGTPLGFFREDSSGWVAFYPQTGEAFIHVGGRAGASVLGIGAPFSLRDLALLVFGQTMPLTGVFFAESEPVTGEGAAPLTAFRLDGSPVASRLVLDRHGRPVEMSGGDGTSWTVRFTGYAGEEANTPSAIEVELADGRAARLLPRSLTRPTTPFPPQALELPLPPGIVPQWAAP